MRWAGVVVFLFVWTLTTHGKYSAAGDEPHYLIIDQSLLADGDLDLDNNYRHDDGRLFGHSGLEVEGHAVTSRVGPFRPFHNIGLPLVILPAYAAARALSTIPGDSLLRRFRMDRGLFTYSIVSLFLTGLTALGLALTASGLRAAVAPRTAGALVVLAGISPPIASQAFLVFPEVVALFVTCLVVWFTTRRAAEGDERRLAWLALALGALPWMHPKFTLYAAGLLFAALYARRDTIGRRFWFPIAAFVAPQVVLALWTWREWGTPWGAQAVNGLPFSVHALGSGLPGLLIDRQSGVLAYAPIYAVVPACFALTWKRTWPWAVPLALLYLPSAAFMEWWGGFATPARGGRGPGDSAARHRRRRLAAPEDPVAVGRRQSRPRVARPRRTGF